MMSDLEQWHAFAYGAVFPFVVEKDEEYLLKYRRGAYDEVKKPDNWKQVMAIVNGDCLPIPQDMADEITTLFKDITINRWDPWPVLATLKDKLEMALRTDGAVGIVLKRIIDGKTVHLVVDNAAAIWTKWNRIGFEHDRIVWFAALLTPTTVNLADPWLGLMQWKQVSGARLDFLDNMMIRCTQNGGCVGSTTTIEVPLGNFTQLVPLFNAGEVPPGCVTAYAPFYTAAEALPLLEKAYGTPDFEKLIARFKGGKLSRA